MRVLYFSRELSPHDYRFLQALAEHGEDVHALFLEGRSELETRPLPEGVKLVDQRKENIAENPFAISSQEEALVEIVQRVKPDVIHAGPIQGPAYLAAKAGLHPLVSMSWGSDLLVDAQASASQREATQFTLDHSDALIGDCQAVASVAQAFGFPGERMVIFPWGVDLEQYKPVPGGGQSLRQRLGWENSFVLISTRRWEPLLGVDVLCRAFVQAVQQAPQGLDLRLLLLGSGSLKSVIGEILSSQEIHDRVYFAGRVPEPDMPAFFQAADLYVSATHSDGSSVSLMQALASGLPVLVSDIPGNREWINPGRQGWLFKDGSVEELAAAILAAAAARQALPALQQAARRLAEARADWAKNFLLTLAAYQIARERAFVDR